MNSDGERSHQLLHQGHIERSQRKVGPVRVHGRRQLQHHAVPTTAFQQQWVTGIQNSGDGRRGLSRGGGTPAQCVPVTHFGSGQIAIRGIVEK